MLVATPLAIKMSSSPFASLRIVLVLPFIRWVSVLLSTAHVPKARTSCSGWYVDAASVNEIVLALFPSDTLTIAHIPVATPVPPSWTAVKSQRSPVIVHGYVAVARVVLVWVPARVVLLTAMICLSIGRVPTEFTTTVRARFIGRDIFN